MRQVLAAVDAAQVQNQASRPVPPEVIRLVVMMYVRFPLSLRKGEDLLLSHTMRSLRSYWPQLARYADLVGVRDGKSVDCLDVFWTETGELTLGKRDLRGTGTWR